MDGGAWWAAIHGLQRAGSAQKREELSLCVPVCVHIHTLISLHLFSKISWTEEPGGLQSTGSQRVGHD